MRYKLTTQDMKTRKGYTNEVTWEVGRWVEADGDVGQKLCTDAYIHWYGHPGLAVLMNPIHADISNPRLWEVETSGYESDDFGLKGGSQRLRLVREIPVPEVTLEQRVRFAILCGKTVCQDSKWLAWADAWLNGEDRSDHAAADAADAAYAANAASYAAAYAAANAAVYAAAYAANAASYAAAYAANAAYAAARAANAASYAAAYAAANAAVYAAACAAADAADLNLNEIAEEAVKGGE